LSILERYLGAPVMAVKTPHDTAQLENGATAVGRLDKRVRRSKQQII
jgi:hypothetical protein